MQQHLSQLRSFVPVQVHIHQEHVVIDKDSVVLLPTIVTVNTASNHTPPDIAAGRHMGGSGLVVAVPAMALLSASAWFGITNSVALDGEIMEPTHTNVSHEDDSAEDTLWKFRTEAGKHVALSLRDVTYSSSSCSYSHRQPANPASFPGFGVAIGRNGLVGWYRISVHSWTAFAHRTGHQQEMVYRYKGHPGGGVRQFVGFFLSFCLST